MLGGPGTKKLNSRKMLDRTGIEKSSLTQYVRRGWREKPLFSEYVRRGGPGEVGIKNPFNLIYWVGLACKSLFTENAKIIFIVF